jgi:hypothetical protein
VAYRPTFAIDSIGEEDPIAVELALKAMGHLLWALVDIDIDYLVTVPDQFRDPLYEAGIYYDRMEPTDPACGDDDWQDLAHIYENKNARDKSGRPIFPDYQAAIRSLGLEDQEIVRLADCEDLACARVAECHVRWGLVDVGPMVMLQRGGEGTFERPKHLYHVMVRWPEKLPRGVSYPSSVFREHGMLLECPSTVLGMPTEAPEWRPLQEAA